MVKLKKNKFNAKKTILDGIIFDSKIESEDWAFLKQLQAAGIISELSRQVSYDLLVNNIKIGSYRADFKFYDNNEERWRVVDRKGMDTAISKRSRKHVKAQYGIDVEIWNNKKVGEYFYHG